MYAHQESAINMARKNLSEKKKGMLLWHSAGSGKTHTSLKIIKQLAKKNNLIVAPQDTTKNDFIETNKTYLQTIDVILFNEFVSRDPELEENTLLVIDEAHKLLDKRDFVVKLKKIIKGTKDIFVLLVTATPIQNSLSDLSVYFNLLGSDFPESKQKFMEKFGNAPSINIFMASTIRLQSYMLAIYVFFLLMTMKFYNGNFDKTVFNGTVALKGVMSVSENPLVNVFHENMFALCKGSLEIATNVGKTFGSKINNIVALKIPTEQLGQLSGSLSNFGSDLLAHLPGNYDVQQLSSGQNLELTINGLNSYNTFYFIIIFFGLIVTIYSLFGTRQEKNQKIDLQKLSAEIQPFVHFYILDETKKEACNYPLKDVTIQSIKMNYEQISRHIDLKKNSCTNEMMTNLGFFDDSNVATDTMKEFWGRRISNFTDANELEPSYECPKFEEALKFVEITGLERVAFYTNFDDDMIRFLNLLQSKGKTFYYLNPLVEEKDFYCSTTDKFDRKCRHCNSRNIHKDLKCSKCDKDIDCEWRSIILLHSSLIEGVNLFGITTFVIFEPMMTLNLETQLYARVLRNTDYEKVLFTKCNSGTCSICDDERFHNMELPDMKCCRFRTKIVQFVTTSDPRKLFGSAGNLIYGAVLAKLKRMYERSHLDAPEYDERSSDYSLPSSFDEEIIKKNKELSKNVSMIQMQLSSITYDSVIEEPVGKSNVEIDNFVDKIVDEIVRPDSNNVSILKAVKTVDSNLLEGGNQQKKKNKPKSFKKLNGAKSIKAFRYYTKSKK